MILTDESIQNTLPLHDMRVMSWPHSLVKQITVRGKVLYL
uniref:Uncharacterized protein n=1 Tax=Arundo donax TaxID=35708 RepID=A0A0A9F8P1_ARUDO